MKKVIVILIVLIGIGYSSFCQADKVSHLGVNLLQLPTSTLNLNYSIDYKSFITPMVDAGYAFGYNSNFDLPGMFMTPHIKLYDGYEIDKQSGGYIKLGGYLNLRKDFEKQNFFHLGLFITNSIVYEKGIYYQGFELGSDPEAENIEHTVYLFGLSSSIGYEFKISKRLKMNIDFQLSFPTDKYLDLYSYTNFIPGMGYKAIKSKWFPMLIVNLKYRL